MASLLGADGSMVNQDLGCQTITIVPQDMAQTGDMNYVLILSQPDGGKDAMASVAQLCDLKQGTAEITDTIIDENGETKNVLRLVPKKMVGEMNNQQLVCDYCNYTSPKRYLLTRHMKSHSEERPFKCEACNRGFKTPASLLNHVNTHTGTRPHKCKTCEAAFTTSGELVRHIRYRHTFEKPHRCPECDYASVELSKLKRHMRSHTGERPYKCPSCPYASPDTYKLKRHMRIHTGEKPYECDICHARFTQSNSLKAHKLIHTGNKPVYQCSLCPTTCGRKTDLKIHFNKLHAVGSPLDCKKCGKAFSDRYSYKQHVRSHDVDKCFKCDQCDFVAATEKNLELHMSVHKNYECEECNLSFPVKPSYDKHRAMFHGGAAKSLSVMTEEKLKEESDTSFVTALGRYDLPDMNSEEESSHLLTTPSASDTLHKNLMQDIKEGKLGDVPQVVIVHPDGSQEEISSKLTGDKWSIGELFSTATNNGQTRLSTEEQEDKDSEEDRDMKTESEFSLTPAVDDGGSNSSGPMSHSLLQTSVDDPQGVVMMADDDHSTPVSCFGQSDVSQLCEASTQAEIESDTDSCGETPDHDMLHLHEISESLETEKQNNGVKDSGQLVSKTVMTAIKTSSSLSSLSIVGSLNSTANPAESFLQPSITTLPNSYLKSLIVQKPVGIKSSLLSSTVASSSTPSTASLSSLLISSPSSSASSSLSSSLLSSSTKKLTSVLQFPKSILGSPTKSTGQPLQQYSLLKNLNIKSSSSLSLLPPSTSSSLSSLPSSTPSSSSSSSFTSSTDNNAQQPATGKDSVVKLFVDFGTPGSDNTNVVSEDLSTVTTAPTTASISIASHQTVSKLSNPQSASIAATDSLNAHSRIISISLPSSSSKSATSCSNVDAAISHDSNDDTSDGHSKQGLSDSVLTYGSKVNKTYGLFSDNIDPTGGPDNVSSGISKSGDGSDICDKEQLSSSSSSSSLSSLTLSSSHTFSSAPIISHTNSISAGLNTDESNSNSECSGTGPRLSTSISSPPPPPSFSSLLSSSSHACDRNSDKTSLSTTKKVTTKFLKFDSERICNLASELPLFQKPITGLLANSSTNDLDTDVVSGKVKGDDVSASQPLSDNKGQEMLNDKQQGVELNLIEAKATGTVKKGKGCKRHHHNMDQSLVMQGKRVRKALVKVSL